MLERLLIYRLCNLSRGIRQIAARDILAPLDLDLRDWFVLAAVGELGSCPQRDVARRIQMDKVAVNRAAARLKKRGLLGREHNSFDGRSHLLRLTDLGWEVLTTSAIALGAVERELLGDLATGRNASLDGALARLEAALRRLERTAPPAGQQPVPARTRRPELVAG
ncbi:MAG: MarR family winged helix-turn-helix transcriptional regulator [Candidatus Andeanibacterium colombiense]|uniref:MarR family winged helix-turn-helix transcriptional regulator n=1 Tax=Candidatus Andeanibacterium colombiense TaxID=3121345 RepID=A0AAJ5X3H7_9SPHN|nr:MAG: MarR family winged helix-turn-helix transcriptional regulator [Sphingomonadaceae bacterium]